MAFLQRLKKEFSGTHQFIYTVAFVTPVLYLFVEQHQRYLGFLKSKKRKTEGVLKFAPEGFGWVLIWAFFVFMLTTAGYAVSTTREMRTEDTLLESFSKYTVVWVYVFAMFCWYFTILDAADITPSDFASTKKKGEAQFSKEFDERLSGEN